MIKRIYLLLFLITASLCINSTAHAYYFIEPLGYGKLFLQSGVYISKGPSESLSFYTQYGFAKWFDIKMRVPGIIYHDDTVKDRYFYSNPYVGYLAEFARDENNSFSFTQNYTLPFHAPRGLDVATRIEYRRIINGSLKYFAMILLPFNKCSGRYATYSIGVVPIGFEYLNKWYFNQTSIEFSEKMTPYKEFQAGFSSYNSFLIGFVSPSIEISYFPSPKTSIWNVTIGVTKIINML